MYPNWQIICILFAIAMIAVPFASILLRRRRGWSAANALPATLAYVVAFDLVFFVQELTLVLSKALVPGLHPILFHNNHDWTGDAAVAELLQGVGALTILILGLAALAWQPRGTSWRLVAAWIAFNGIVQSLAQGFAGAILPGNDVGRAMTYLAFGPVARAAVVVTATLAMAVLLPRVAARLAAAGVGCGAIVIALVAGTILVLPFRVPGSLDQVVIVPIAVALIGAGWLLLPGSQPAASRPGWRWFAIAALVIFAVFQLVLRPGIAV